MKVYELLEHTSNDELVLYFYAGKKILAKQVEFRTWSFYDIDNDYKQPHFSDKELEEFLNKTIGCEYDNFYYQLLEN